ncbi:unnamed protein product [Schistocephalus solidus]|uniref:Phosphatidylinositol 3-kinase catalytic subunit type 3 n=1 Tax=Schistocephalus solidus TaxID=70667 RepID=A0A183SDX3_SCHSO|nr:unnamed protein product [Schistocephalus solidus]
MSVTGFHAEDFRISNGKHNALSCYGEPKIAYCITQSIPCLDSHRVGAWSETHSSRDWRRYYIILSHQQDSFNESIELPLPYSSLYDYNGICLILCSTFTDASGVHDQYLAGGYLTLYNSKRIFRNGIYELELRSLQPHAPRSLNEALEVIIAEDFNAKPKELEELNRLLKVNSFVHLFGFITNRKQMRGELFDTPLDRHTLPFIERTIEELKRKSGKIFLSLKFEFSRSYPHLYLPVLFERPWNPVDEMYFKMTRNVRTADMDRERKPNKDILDKLKVFPPFLAIILERRSLAVLQSALPKFLLSVRWEYPEQVTQAIELLHQWPAIDPENILELLTKQFPHSVCRKFAVARLQSATAEDLQLYLYQLVQALRYENISAILAVRPMTAETAIGHVDTCKTDDAVVAPTDPAIDTSHASTQETTKRTVDVLRGRPHDIAASLSLADLPWDMDLASFLIQRALQNFETASFLYWFLQLEANESTPSTPMIRKMFEGVLQRLLAALKHIELLRARLKTNDRFSSLFARPVPLPLDPTFIIGGIDSDSATLFKSTMQPALLSLVSRDGEVYRVIFKIGDDLRQDQLVLQMIQLMDVVLQKEKFNLQLTPYKVLAASCRHGLIEFVEAISLASTRQEGSILNYLQHCAPSPTDPLGVQPKVLDTYIRSCAGYCVITYLLGVGDRHMENIMLTSEGQLFHIDFGFILGNDPKPMAPEVRLTKAMIEAMGGHQTKLFNEFWKICLTAFLSLRRHANLFLTLFSLVHDTGIHDVARDPSKACEFLKERFCIDQTDEKAAFRFASRLTDSVKAFVPEMMERIHSVVQVCLLRIIRSP